MSSRNPLKTLATKTLLRKGGSAKINGLHSGVARKLTFSAPKIVYLFSDCSDGWNGRT